MEHINFTINNMMKIVHIVPCLKRAGAERFVVDLANSQSQLGNELYIISLYNDDEHNSLKSEIDDKVTCVEMGKTPKFSFSLLLKIHKEIIKIEPDIVNTHLAGFEYSLYTMIKLSKRVKFFNTVHSLAQIETPNKYLKKVKGWFYLNKIISPINISKFSLINFNEYYGLSSKCVIYNGRPKLNVTSHSGEIKDRLNLLAYDFVFVNVARISEEKNHLLLVKSFMEFNEDKNCILIIVGAYNEDKTYKNLISLKDDRIVFEGLKSNIADYLSVAHAFCLTSTYEGMPISLIEALSMGCVPIVTSVGGMTEMIADENIGFLCQDLKVTSFKNELNNFYFCQMKDILKRNCIENFDKKYNIEITSKNYLDKYNF